MPGKSDSPEGSASNLFIGYKLKFFDVFESMFRLNCYHGTNGNIVLN